MLLRIRKRLTSFDEPVDEAYLVEFYDQKTGSPDLALSVFEVDDAPPPITQACAEFAASFKREPPKGYSGVGVSGIKGPELVSTDGATQFKFTSDAHRELKFSNGESHRGFFEVVYNEQVTRKRTASDSDVRAHVLARCASGDDEWISLRGTKPAWDKWVTKQPKPPQPPTSPTPVSKKADRANRQVPPAAADESTKPVP